MKTAKYKKVVYKRNHMIQSAVLGKDGTLYVSALQNSYGSGSQEKYTFLSTYWNERLNIPHVQPKDEVNAPA